MLACLDMQHLYFLLLFVSSFSCYFWCLGWIPIIYNCLISVCLSRVLPTLHFGFPLFMLMVIALLLASPYFDWYPYLLCQLWSQAFCGAEPDLIRSFSTLTILFWFKFSVSSRPEWKCFHMCARHFFIPTPFKKVHVNIWSKPKFTMKMINNIDSCTLSSF